MICVFGSINVDLVCRVASIAKPGETVLSPGYEQFPGGKGANQAVAAARAGADVEMIGAVGADGFGDLARANLDHNRVGVEGVSTSDLPTGCAFIVVSESGENVITVASGSNLDVRAGRIKGASTLVAQMELPAEETLLALRRASRSGVRTILNFAPVPLSVEKETLAGLLGYADVLVVNEHELIALCDVLRIAKDAVVLAMRVKCQLIVTRGGEGILVYDPIVDADPFVATAPDVDVVDTTGAGDTFVGVLAAGLDNGLTLQQASYRAMIAASMACSSSGAQAAMPTLAELEAFIKSI